MNFPSDLPKDSGDYPIVFEKLKFEVLKIRPQKMPIFRPTCSPHPKSHYKQTLNLPL